MLGYLLAAAVLYLIIRAARQFRAFAILEPAPPGKRDLPNIVVIVPARNEADVIGRCLEGLAAQDYPRERLRAIVVDDGSSDGTQQRAARFANERLEIMPAGPLPKGWLGKSHACWRAAQEARGADYLCFLDADTVPGAALVRTSVIEAGRRGLALLSLEPFQELQTVWERLILPAGFFALAFTRTVAAAEDPANDDAAVNGQFLLVKSEAYWRAGGHRAVRSAVAEDSQLAGLVKAADGRVAVMGGAPLIRARMYRNFAALWQGLGKSSTDALGGPGAALAVALIGPALSWSLLIAPPIMALSLPAHAGLASVAGVVFGFAAAFAAIGLHGAGARYFGIPLWYGLLFPVGYTLAAIVALDGLRMRRARRVVWKGRAYRMSPE